MFPCILMGLTSSLLFYFRLKSPRWHSLGNHFPKALWFINISFQGKFDMLLTFYITVVINKLILDLEAETAF